MEKTSKILFNGRKKFENLKKIRMVLTSDTHSSTDEVDWPHGDILLHSGDFTRDGTEDEFKKFNSFCKKMKETRGFKEIVVIAGNHEVTLDPKRSVSFQKEFLGVQNPKSHEFFRSLLTECIYLENQEVALFDGGLRIYGTPAICEINSRYMGFCLEEKELNEAYSSIPKGIDVLLSHVPPLGILDYSPTMDLSYGSNELRKEVLERIKPKIHLFGHTHEGNKGAMHMEEGIIFINGSLVTLNNNPIRPIYSLDFVTSS